ncbi:MULTISPECIES: hypothetical protein [Streptomyces]|uniref:hypothetical protein n=1 Tax=Streptomyces scabiei TaxID=1930 RepID=UPI0011D1CDF0|nr:MULTISPECIES: hypothetical protein [Streptomyces]MBP5861435.1 hypothetical protein [Streptomyces sp. LBUM 1484]MBP5869632.1 hypothetical protein [Streptomyces sp. LBUM 1485]MBP5928976.1 hypothetical protein [Streptomyces sp. LBUM 1479]MBP5878135.1 hypothetical protein [Streptomyces sp. LBUM 1477]MBP5885971.1 hypothetical protein [Streptomyces sp. LBUM 1487]
MPGADGPAGERMPPISLGDHEQVGVIAVTSTDAPPAAHTLLAEHGFWRPRGVFGSILIHDRYDHDVPARLTRFLADADRQGIGVEYHLPRILADAGSPAAGKRVEELWRDNQQREYRRCQREAVRIATFGSDLESLAHGLCHRLPGEWASHVTGFADPDSQLDFFDDLWDNASLASAWMQFRVPRAAILTRPDRLELVVIDRPLHRGQVLVGALSLHGITHDYFGDDNAPHAIAVPSEAVRAAHTVSRRLLPATTRPPNASGTHARIPHRPVRLHHRPRPAPAWAVVPKARRLPSSQEPPVERTQPEPLHRLPAPEVAHTLTLSWYPDGVVGAPYRSVPEDARMVFGCRFQYSPHESAFVLPTSYSTSDRAVLIQTAVRLLTS